MEKTIKLIFLGKNPADPGRLILKLDDIGVTAKISIYKRIKKEGAIAEYCVEVPENKITNEFKDIVQNEMSFIYWRSNKNGKRKQ